MSRPTTAAGKALVADKRPYLAAQVVAIEQQAVAAWLASPAPAVLLADAQLPEAEILRALAALRAKP